MAKFVFTGIYTNPVKLPTATKQYIAVDITDLPKGIPIGINPRSQNMNSRPVKDMIAALEKHDQDFPLLNGGIKLICKNASQVGPHKIAICMSEDDKSQGIVDGGHTYRTLVEFMQRHPDYEKGVYVSLEILYGDRVIERCVDIAAARNTAAQVKRISIMNAMGKFDRVKEVIKDYPWANEVSWEENQPGRIRGEMLISLMMLFDIESFGRRSGSHPCTAYNSFDGTLKQYDASISKGIDNSIYGKLIKLLPKFIELHDYVQMSIPRWYNASGGKFGLIQSIDTKGPGKTMFSQEEIKYNVTEAIVMPILTTARMLLQINGDGELVWSYNPYQFFDLVGRDVSRALIRGMADFHDVNKYLKLPKTWKDAYGDARDAYNDARGEF